VVGVNGFDILRQFFGPSGDGIGIAVGTTRKVANSVGSAARFISKFPSKDCLGIFKALDDGLDIVLICRLDLLVGIEL
jgi:hypothetical protein